MIDIDHLERRITHRADDEPLLPPSPEEVLALIAEIRRLRGTDFCNTPDEAWAAWDWVEG